MWKEKSRKEDRKWTESVNLLAAKREGERKTTFKKKRLKEDRKWKENSLAAK